MDQTYYTQKGREVFGGGGIKPDISIELEPEPDYIQSLQRRRLFFDFAIDYVSTDSSWALAHPELIVGDEMVDRFMEFVRATVENEARDKTGESQIEEIANIAEDMGWGDAVQESIHRLRISVEQEWDQPISSKLKPFLKSAIHRELVLRFKGRKAQLLEELREDPQLTKAMEVLADQNRYARVLSEGEVE